MEFKQGSGRWALGGIQGEEAERERAGSGEHKCVLTYGAVATLMSTQEMDLYVGRQPILEN